MNAIFKGIDFNDAGHRHDMLDVMRTHMDDTELLDALVRQMSDDEAREAFDFLARMYDFANLEKE